MCVTFFSYDCHPLLLFLVAFNRDEYLQRPTERAHFWPDQPSVLAGRDSLRKGTWLGITTGGRIAFLTNYREVRTAEQQSTRGELITSFLLGNKSPTAFAKAIEHNSYAGFNLVVGDVVQPSLVYCSNRADPAARLLTEGNYGLSNGLLMEWPKVHKGLPRLHTILEGYQTPEPATFPWEQVFDHLLSDASKELDPMSLPMTGFPKDVEQNLSSIFIPESSLPAGAYGTRSQTVVAVWRTGHVEYQERSLDNNKSWHEERHQFQIPLPSHMAGRVDAGDEL